MNWTNAFLGLAVALFAACDTAPLSNLLEVDAGIVDASRVHDDLVKQVDASLAIDLAHHADLAQDEDMAKQPDIGQEPDMAQAPDLAPRTFRVSVSNEIKSTSIQTCSGEAVIYASLGITYTNQTGHTIVASQSKFSGTASTSVANPQMTADQLDNVVLGCRVVKKQGGGEILPLMNVDGFGQIMYGNNSFEIPPGVMEAFLLCDLAKIGPSGAVYALGIRDSRDIVAYDRDTNDAVVAVIDQALIDNAGSGASAVVNTILTDYDAPIITMNGKNPDTIVLGLVYNDPGASALDNGKWQTSVNTSGYVNPNWPGTYSITYTATDVCWNTATAKRTVEVVNPFCATIDVNGQKVNAEAVVTVDWALDTPRGAASPGVNQVVAKIMVTNLALQNTCQEVDITSLDLNFLFTFPVGESNLYLDSLQNAPVVTRFIPDSVSPFVATFPPGTFRLAVGQTRAVYITMNTLGATSTNALSIRANAPIGYRTTITGAQYLTDAENYLPLVYKTITFQ